MSVTPLVGDPARFLALAVLEARLRSIPAAPRDRGRAVLLLRRPAEGSREVLRSVALVPGQGVPGDRWSLKPVLDPTTQIAAMQLDVAELVANGQSLSLFGDNLILELDLSEENLPVGSRLRAGSALLEVTPTAHTPCAKFRVRFGEDSVRFVSTDEARRRRLRGVYLRAVEPGEIRTGDTVEVVSRPR